MKQFMMQGMAITGPMRYRECFCPKDLLRFRELAAGFFFMHYRMLSCSSNYHADMFYRAVFTDDTTNLILSPSDYCDNERVLIGINTFAKKAYLTEYFSDPGRQKSLKEFWFLSLASGLPEQDQRRLFCLLAAGYALAGKTLHDCPLTPEQARYAYLRQVKDDMVADDGWLALPKSGSIYLHAQVNPYKILIRKGAAALLEKGAEITPRKLIAAPHRQGITNIPVTLHIYDDPNAASYRELRINYGEYIYVNFVEDIPVWFHPVSAQTSRCRISRSKGRLTVSGPAVKAMSFDCSGLDIIGFAPEEEAFGWILLSELGTDYSSYSHRLTFGAVLPDEKYPIVQVEFRKAECLLLDKHGYVHSNLNPVSKMRVTSLGEYYTK